MKASQALLSLILLLPLSAQGDETASTIGNQHKLKGTWVLKQIKYPSGETYNYPNVDRVTRLQAYDDSVMYTCVIQYLDSGFVIIPETKTTYTDVYKGHGERLYFEDDAVRPIKFAGDSIINIQRHGRICTYTKANGYVQTNEDGIFDIVRNFDFSNNNRQRFMFSMTESTLRQENHTLLYILASIIIITFVLLAYTLRVHIHDKRLRKQLKQISDERKIRPVKVEKALKEVEDDFIHSDYYFSIERRVAAGDRLDDEDWKEMERQLNSAYPQFSRNLFGLIRLSDTEYKVCMLVKMRIRQKDIATVLYKTPNAISSIRARLYQKVFLKKGKATDWDDFIMTL